ncbi:MAG: hypothetical protein NTV68_03455, partial [Methanomicrobiales archaeon]|nr:hypothetical protein [Methanomicrobiales archaeon]
MTDNRGVGWQAPENVEQWICMPEGMCDHTDKGNIMAGAIRVLYVDDESDLLEIGKLFLEQSGDFAVT